MLVTWSFLACLAGMPSPSPEPAVSRAPTHVLLILENGKKIEIDDNGTIHLPSGMKITEAARELWGALDYLNPLRDEVRKLRVENAQLQKLCLERK